MKAKYEPRTTNFARRHIRDYPCVTCKTANVQAFGEECANCYNSELYAFAEMKLGREMKDKGSNQIIQAKTEGLLNGY